MVCFRMHNIQVFQLIEQKKLYGEILQHLKTLMEIITKVRFASILSPHFPRRCLGHIRHVAQSYGHHPCEIRVQSSSK